MRIKITISWPAFALTALAVVLKLTGVISWSWLWVLAPLWAPLGVVLALWIVVLMLAVFDRTGW
jgi:hypothetical protein